MKKSLAGLFLLVMFSACRFEHTRSEPHRTAPANASPAATPAGFEPDVTVPEFINQMPFLEKSERAAMIKAWDALQNHEGYSAARSLAHKNVISDYGEIAGAYGLALFVIDATRTDADRHGLVVILRRSAGHYDAYWIYHDQDLSNFNMSRSSGSIFIWKPRDDGTRTTCRLEWVRAKGKWTCEQVGQ
jgi:hypothetical protein